MALKLMTEHRSISLDDMGEEELREAVAILSNPNMGPDQTVLQEARRIAYSREAQRLDARASRLVRLIVDADNTNLGQIERYGEEWEEVIKRARDFRAQVQKLDKLLDEAMDARKEDLAAKISRLRHKVATEQAPAPVRPSSPRAG